MTLARIAFTALLIVGAQAPCPAQYLQPSLLKAAEAARMGNATRQQKALLFMHNDAINQARLGGYLPDSTYQAAQREYSQLNQAFAQSAAQSHGADFTVQQSTSATYSPGTDSDYIVTAKGADPVEQIRGMQETYNQHVNDYLDDALGKDGAHHVRRNDWHNQLDVDFMADPAHVTDQQFREIAELNNDAYTRRGSAEYERRSRAGGLEVTADQFTDYANEMQDFIDKKQKYLDKIKKNPSSLTDPKTMVEQHRLMAQEAKYTSRIQQANATLRKQEGLPPKKAPPKGPPVYEITKHPNGKTSIRKRPTGTLAEMGAKRSPTNRGMTGTASAVANNSVQQAVMELSESMSEAAAKNPKKWPNAQRQIASMTERLPPAAKGQLLDRLAANRQASALDEILRNAGDLDEAGMQAARARARKIGNDYSKGVAREMQQRIRSQRTLGVRADNYLKDKLGKLGYTDDMSKMRGLRGTANRRLASVMGGVEKLGHLGTALEVIGAASSAYSGLSNLYNARDENLTAAQMRELQRRAAGDFARLGQQGLLAGISYAVPTAGAMIGGYDMGYAAGRYVLENTELGRMADAAALAGFDAAFQSWEEMWRRVEGRGKLAAEEAKRRRKLEEAYWNALRRGEIRMKPGTTIEEFLRRLREGDLASVRDLFEAGPNASDATKERFAKKEPKKRRDPNNDLEWISQTHDIAGDQAQIDEFHRLQAEGRSPIGPAPDREEEALPLADSLPETTASTEPDYRARAEEFLRRSRPARPSAAAASTPDYRAQAERIHQRVVAVEAERERQARLAEARRQEALRQEALRQEAMRREAQRQEALRQEAWRRQQIAAQQARQRQIALQQAWARQQQRAQQQQAWNNYWAQQAALMRQQQAAIPYRQNNLSNMGTLFPSAPRDGSIMGNAYYDRNSGGGYYNGSEYDYNSNQNPIRW